MLRRDPISRLTRIVWRNIIESGDYGGELDSTEIIETKDACRGSTHLVKKVENN